MIITKKKDFTYRGKTMEELQTLEVREFAKYLKSRSRRTVLKNFQDIEKFVNESKEKISRDKKIKTHKRDIVIVPAMIGMKMQIYNGKTFEPVEITGEMLGHRLGEFAPTKKRVQHGSAGIGATKGSKHKAKK
ncbi:30S ribosomal protein S19 [Candidatus Pacearchaeota archaeon]|nr:30S ribosomal protein S19 [Candidatus Pacearchaeota archaeon]